jgi:predicted transcriptional regulator
MEKLIKKKILNETTLASFADEHGIRRATLSDFLNGKRDIRVSTLKRIIAPLKIVVIDLENR